MNIFEMSIKMETDAIAFYVEASEKTKHPAGKKMFLSVADDEKRHLDMLSKVFKGLDLKIKDICETNPMSSIKTIFEEMRDEMMQKVAATSDEMEAFKIAMHMEREGMEYYKKAAAGASSETEKKLFEVLISEEGKHYAIFSNTYSFMKDSGNWFMWDEQGILEG